jgi:hypothetical protein
MYSPTQEENRIAESRSLRSVNRDVDLSGSFRQITSKQTTRYDRDETSRYDTIRVTISTVSLSHEVLCRVVPGVAAVDARMFISKDTVTTYA